jgi:WD40 repeat protein
MEERLRSLFLAALDLEEDERAAFLDRECGDDSELRAMLVSLLRFEFDPNLPTAALTGEAPPPPDSIGRYRLVEAIGRGGFGIVYLAHQTEPIKRTVALKMVLLGMDTRIVLARFDAERQLMAMMDHPHIAQVFDAGQTDEGRPYFVMEYVPGIPITDYCDQNRLSIEERLDLFVQVCSAIQHAHQKGVIHRDIKPSNVLVTSKSGDPTAKVIDFGVAKAIDRPLAERGVFTLQGQLIGTPEYMSPEQAEMRPEDVDTRTDIYSLGVLLYELLTGSLPFDPKTLRAQGLAEIYRIIREVEPPRPSTRISTMGEQSSARASARRIDSRSLIRELRDDLDWITMKAMEKDRTRRYSSASEFAEDVQRHLRHEPVVACPPSAMYRVTKFVRRHQIGVAATAAIALALVAGVIGTTWQMLRAQGLQREAEQRERVAVRQSYLGHLGAASLALEVDQLANARRHLDLAPAEHRGWEWRYLHRRLDDSRRTLEGHARDLVAAVMDPAGEVVISASIDGELRWWRIGTGEPVATWRAGDGAVMTMALDPNGDRLATGGDGHVIRIADARTRTHLTDLEGHQDIVTALAFSPDGRLLASGGGDGDGTVRIWDLATGVERSIWRVHAELVNAVQFGPDGRQLVSAGYDGMVLLWDVASGTSTALTVEDDERANAEAAIPGAPPEVADCVVFSPDGRRLAVCRDLARTVELWDTGTASRSIVLDGGHSASVTSVAFSPDGSLIVTGSADRTLVLWDANDGRKRAVLRGHTAAVTAVLFTPDGDQLVSASADRTLRVWDAALIDWSWTLDDHERTVYDLAAGVNDAVSLWSAAADRQVVAWGGAPPRALERWRGGEAIPTQIAADPIRSRVAVGTLDGRVLLWTSETGEPRELGRHDGQVTALAFSGDGETIASAGVDGRVCLWSPRTGGLLTCLAHGPDVADIAFTADGERIITVAGDDTVRIWDRNGALVDSLVAPDRRLSVLAVDSAARWLAAAGGGNDQNILVWDLESQDPVRELSGHEQSVTALTFCPMPTAGGRREQEPERLVSASSDLTVRVWDVAFGEEVLSLHGHTGPVFSVVFSPDGARLFSASMDTTIRVWDTVPAYRQLPPR